jgi:hypothetical protein
VVGLTVCFMRVGSDDPRRRRTAITITSGVTGGRNGHDRRERTIRGSTINARAEVALTENTTAQAGWLNKNFTDAAEQDIEDYTVKLVWRYFWGLP